MGLPLLLPDCAGGMLPGLPMVPGRVCSCRGVPGAPRGWVRCGRWDDFSGWGGATSRGSLAFVLVFARFVFARLAFLLLALPVFFCRWCCASLLSRQSVSACH